MLRGVVKHWDDTAGRGLLTSPDLPEDVAASADALRGRARELSAGDAVLFDYEHAADDDDVAFRATWVKARALV